MRQSPDQTDRYYQTYEGGAIESYVDFACSPLAKFWPVVLLFRAIP